MAVLANVALTNTFDTWRLRTNALLTRVNAYTINESSLYANTLTANVSFLSKGLGTFNGRVTIGTNLNVSGNTTIGAAGKIANVTGWLGVAGRATVSTNLFIGGNTSVGGLKANNSLGSSGYFLRTNGTTAYWDALPPSTQYLQVANAVATYATKVNPSTSGLLNHTGRIAVGTNLSVSGNTTLGGASKTLTVGGSGATANVTGWFGITGRASVSTNFFVGGNTTLNGTTTDRSNALSQTLTDGTTINWDVSLGRVATVTLGGNRTMAAPTNLKVGTYILYVVQDGTGSRTLTWNSAFKWTAAVAPPLTTTANARDIFSFVSDGTNLYGSFIPDVR
jgi:hypothetical protein